MTRTPRGNGLRTDRSAADNYLTHDAGVPAPHEGDGCFVARKLVVLAAQQHACPARMVGRWCEDGIHSVLTNGGSLVRRRHSQCAHEWWVVGAKTAFTVCSRMVGRWCEDGIHSVLTSEHAKIIIILVDHAMTEFASLALLKLNKRAEVCTRSLVGSQELCGPHGSTSSYGRGRRRPHTLWGLMGCLPCAHADS
jgi:hypothetical protein